MIDLLTASRYFKVYEKCKRENILIEESFYPTQVSSKLWLVDELKKTNLFNNKKIKIEIVGSWFGWPLVGLLFDNFDIQNVKLYDIDKTACYVSGVYSRIFMKEDIVEIINKNYWLDTNRESEADLIINCSSEHMFECFYDYNFYKKNCVFVIQSNNLYDEPTHINCCDSEDELVEINSMSNILYKGSLSWNDTSNSKKLKRFMAIGYI